MTSTPPGPGHRPGSGPSDGPVTVPSADIPIVVIVGPTAAGKSQVALDLAQRVGGEIVSADSQQVYRGMDIGTGKVSRAVRERVRHHLIDVIDPDAEMTAARFVELADQAIAEARGRGAPVIVAGGTGLYVRILLFGLFPGPGRDAEVRRRLHDEAAALGGAPGLWQRLSAVDPECAARIEPSDLRRIVRALEVYELSGRPMSEHQRDNDFRTLPMRYRARLVGIAGPREILYQRIETRVDAMIAAGLEGEVRALRERGHGPELRSQAAIGYAEMHQMLDGTIDQARAVELIKRNSRRYARRQLSWYRALDRSSTSDAHTLRSGLPEPSDRRVAWHESPSDIDLAALQRFLGQ